MPPIREHHSLEAHHNPSASSEDEDPSSPAKSDKSTSPSTDKDRKRGKRSPSINTRASRVGVTNFINVIKSLHPGESINYFPITKETLQQYIDSKRKALIKAGSLEQYLQHIQAYNIALGFGWDGHIFGPIIKKALDELRSHEDEILKSSNSQPIMTIPDTLDTIMSISDPLDTIVTSSASVSEAMTIDSRIPDLFTINETDVDPIESDMTSFGDQEISSKFIPTVCFDTTKIPFTILDQRVRINLDNLNSSEPLQNLRQLYSNVSFTNFPKPWGSVDTLRLYYRIGTQNDSQHFGLFDESTFNRFWSSYNDSEAGKEIQLVVYRNADPVNISGHIRTSPEPFCQQNQSISRTTYMDRRSDIPILKSVTIRSKKTVYKQKIAVSDATTFASLIAFAIKATPPAGKQFVIRASDGALEYVPSDIVRDVIVGVEHIDLIVTVEDIKQIDFDCF
ncbi:14274_t:CDS:2 [Cetraspora pellucida]|uniref:14274_t:CDS:1 n=1 Tax=Cetraspora pellucida TaxID=1433469 RepID=A0A9N8VPW6_9GLOM|nr:14274_t:CDS:2 [Cetraspora pellucida]